MDKFSKKSVFESKIRELSREILMHCSQHQIPVFMSFAVENDDEKTTYVNELLSPAFLGVELTDNKFPNHALVMDGWRTIPPFQRPSDEEEMEVVSNETLHTSNEI